MSITAIVYNVDWSGKVNKNADHWGNDPRFKPAFHNVGAFLRTAMLDKVGPGPVDFIAIPEGSSDLVNFLQEREYVPVSYGVIFQDEKHCGLGGIILIYSLRFRVVPMVAGDCPDETPDAACSKRCPLRSRRLGSRGGGVRHAVPSAACGGCTTEVGRPVVVARFADAGKEFLVAAVQMGHGKHAEDLATVKGYLDHLQRPRDHFTLLFGDLNTHYGMRSANLDQALQYRRDYTADVAMFWKKKGAKDVTLPLKEVRRAFYPQTVHTVGAFEPVTCCCPPQTPWKFNDPFYGGAGCAGQAPAAGEAWFRAVHSAADVAALKRQVADPACTMLAAVLQAKASGSVMLQNETDMTDRIFSKELRRFTIADAPFHGEHKFKFKAQEETCQNTQWAALPPLNAKTVAAPLRPDEFMFDQILVVMQHGVEAVKTQAFGLGVPVVPASDHFPVVANIEIPLVLSPLEKKVDSTGRKVLRIFRRAETDP